jgi:hypothetical protein
MGVSDRRKRNWCESKLNVILRLPSGQQILDVAAAQFHQTVLDKGINPVHAHPNDFVVALNFALRHVFGDVMTPEHQVMSMIPCVEAYWQQGQRPVSTEAQAPAQMG